MGRFQVNISVGHPRGGDLIDVEAVVDTGATHTVLPQSLLDQLHVEPLDHRDVVMPDRSIRNMGIGEARIAYAARNELPPSCSASKGNTCWAPLPLKFATWRGTSSTTD